MIATAEHQGQTQLRLLKIFAEMCSYCGVIENASTRIESIYTILRVTSYYLNSIINE